VFLLVVEINGKGALLIAELLWAAALPPPRPGCVEARPCSIPDEVALEFRAARESLVIGTA
jgi:hypothetical protein